jgi:exonuclease VII small subunit
MRSSTMEEFEEAIELNEVGDTLFVFIMRELEETADTLETAADAMERARDELEEVRAAIEAGTMEVPDEDGGDNDGD